MSYEKIHKPKPLLEIVYHKYHRLVKIGGSLGITITEPLKLIGITGKDKVSVKVDKGRIIITKINGENT